tara:strand:- start:972 stop:1088 length:117 start_codon:yes stop_codon:yes gene_type:complete
MSELQFFVAVAALLPALYFTLRFIVWISDKIERKNEKK